VLMQDRRPLYILVRNLMRKPWITPYTIRSFMP
jgi:hypothetical protein